MARLIPSFITLFLLLSACTNNTIRYGSDYRSTVDFSRYETYVWHEPNQYNKSSEVYIADPQVDEQIRSTIDQFLYDKGFRLVEGTSRDSDSVDFKVNYTITAQGKVEVNSYNGRQNGFAAYYSYGAGGYRDFSPDKVTEMSHYTQGTFVLDIIGGQDGKLEWRGTAAGRMTKSKLTAEQRDKVIWEVVTGVLAAFPPES